MTAARRLLVSPAALADLQEIGRFIGRDNPARAASFVDELESKCLAISRWPESYPSRAGLVPGLRCAAYGRYLLFYRILPDQDVVQIERVIHGARDLRRLSL